MSKFKYIKREWKNGKWQYTYPYDPIGKDKASNLLDKINSNANAKTSSNTSSNKKWTTTHSVNQKKVVDPGKASSLLDKLKSNANSNKSLTTTRSHEPVTKDKATGVLDKLKDKVDKASGGKTTNTTAKTFTNSPEKEKPKVDNVLKKIGDKPVTEVSAIPPVVTAAITLALIRIGPQLIAAAALKTAQGLHELGEKVESKITEKRAEKSREEANEKAQYDKKLADQLSELKQNDPLPDLPVKTEATSREEDMAAINPEYDSGKWAYSNNCSYCTAAYDLRLRGYDVEADAISVFDPPTTVDELTSWYDGEVVEDLWDSIKRQDPVAYAKSEVSYEVAAECLEKDMLRHGEGARGHLLLYWQGGGGHDVIWEVTNGNVVIRDCQTNEKLQVYDYLQYCETASYFRTDNVQPNEKILETVRSRKRGG